MVLKRKCQPESSVIKRLLLGYEYLFTCELALKVLWYVVSKVTLFWGENYVFSPFPQIYDFKNG